MRNVLLLRKGKREANLNRGECDSTERIVGSPCSCLISAKKEVESLIFLCDK